MIYHIFSILALPLIGAPSLPANSTGEARIIEFDGVMANSEVRINGHHLGKRPSGYVGFRYELTEHVNFGEKQNVLAVRADNSRQRASRWYTGAGVIAAVDSGDNDRHELFQACERHAYAESRIDLAYIAYFAV